MQLKIHIPSIEPKAIPFLGICFMIIGTIACYPAFSQGLLNTGATITQSAGTYIVLSDGSNGSYTADALSTTNLEGEGIVMTGNLSAEGTVICPSCTLKLNGNSNQTLLTSGNSFGNVEMDKTGETLLQDDLTITEKLILTNGVITTGANLAIITNPDSAALAGGSDSSFVYCKLKRSFDINDDTYIFPVGLGPNSSDYFQADFFHNNLVGTSDLTVSVDAIGEQTGDDELINTLYQGTAIVNVFEHAEWTISPDAQPTSGTYGVNLWIDKITPNNCTCGLCTLQDNYFTVLKRDEQSTTYLDWDAFTNCAIPAPYDPGRTISDGFAQKTGFDSFSKFAIGQGINPLPIDLLSFTASHKDEMILLEWETASETNNEWFTIEKSNDGWDFEEVITIPGAGNSNQLLSYEAIDENPYNGISYYRLKQTDFDGQYEYSKMVPVNFNKDMGMSIALWPNPAIDYLMISINHELDQAMEITLENTETTISIYNAQGEALKQGQVVTITENYRIDLSMLEPGMYFLIINSKNGTNKKSFIKQ